jgi:hypothetical protein
MLKKIGGLVVCMAPMAAFADVDTTALTATLTDIATVAAAVFGVYVAIKASKFIRRAL